MQAIAVKPIPPLPPETAGQWLTVIPEDETMVRRWLNVNRQMDRAYLLEDVQEFRRHRGHRESPFGGAYYYWTPSGEVVLRIGYSNNLKKFLIMSAAFIGAIGPQEALDLIVNKAVEFLSRQGVKDAIAVPRKQMDNPKILQLYALVPSHPRLQVTAERETSLCVVGT